MTFLSKLKSYFLRRKKTEIFEIVETIDGFWVVSVDGYGTMYTGPYKRERDAKGVRTRLLKKNG